MSVDLNLFHRSANRFANYTLMAPIAWAPSLDAWVSANSEVIRNILRDPAYEVVDFKAIYATLSDRFGVDFDTTIKALDYVALGLTGKEHRSVRKQETLFLKANADAAIAAFCANLDETVPAFFANSDHGDMALGIVAPSISAMFSVLSGSSAIDGLDPSLSQVFDRKLSLNKRKSINTRIAKQIVETDIKGTDNEKLLRISLSIVGADTIFASFSQSIMAILNENEGKRMSEINWPELMPHTGIPYLDRFASVDAEIEGQSIKAGDRIRLYVEALLADPDARHSDLFGFGAHLCLGKAISMKAWTAMVQRLSKIDAQVRVLDHEYRKSDFLFNAPAKLQVQISYE